MNHVTTYAPPRKEDDTSELRKVQNKWHVHDDAWWRLERQILGQEFTDITMQIILAGADAGVEALPAGLDVLVDWDVFNQSALDWMRQYLSLDPRIVGDLGGGAYSWVSQLTETTRKTVVNEIDNWVREGAALPVLEARLAPTFGSKRASLIASTEVTRVYAAGNLMAYKATGVVTGKRFLTAVDERVCPLCGPLHNTIVGIDEDWVFTPEMIAANPQLKAALGQQTRFAIPPLHPRCRCWIQPILMEYMDPDELAEGLFENARRRYIDRSIREFANA